eukprot:COSAG01_NODE_929_length_12669_cov_12.073865_10_plen_396_part_00
MDAHVATPHTSAAAPRGLALLGAGASPADCSTVAARQRLAWAYVWREWVDGEVATVAAAGWALAARAVCDADVARFLPSAAVAARAHAEQEGSSTVTPIAMLRALRRQPGWTTYRAHVAAADGWRNHLGEAGSDNTSRCMSIWSALWRLGLLPRARECADGGGGGGPAAAARPLCVWVLGAQKGKEGGSAPDSARVFELLRVLLGWEGVRALHLVLGGPEVGFAAAQGHISEAMDCAPPRTPTVGGGGGACGCTLSVQYAVGLFHELGAAARARQLPAPALVACFQPGLWGYASWEPSIRAVSERARAPSSSSPAICAPRPSDPPGSGGVGSFAGAQLPLPELLPPGCGRWRWWTCRCCMGRGCPRAEAEGHRCCSRATAGRRRTTTVASWRSGD